MRTALLIHAHPDDEVFANFGRARALARLGYRVVGVIATGGEASELHDGSALEAARERRLRKYEESLQLLGADSWTWLDSSAGWIDGPAGATVAEASEQHVRSAVRRIVQRVRPDIVLTVGRDGLTGHPDHVAIGRAVADVTSESPPHEGCWGARLSLSAVNEGRAMLERIAIDKPIGSGRVVGTNIPVASVDVTDSESARREALDIYRDGLGTARLRELVGTRATIGDSVLLRAVLDATRWREELYEDLTSAA